MSSESDGVYDDYQKTDTCSYCYQPLEALGSVSMSHYFDKEYEFWVTRWDTEDYLYCDKCKRVESYIRDEFETPLYPDEVPIELWRQRQEMLRRRKLL